MIENIREAFSGTRGKVLIGGGVVLVAYLVWTRRRTTPDPAAAELAGAVPDDRRRVPQSPPTVGNDAQSDAIRPTDNESWVSQAVDRLSNEPYNYSATALYSALRKALDGQPLTEGERSMVEAAMRELGSPPGGMPALNVKAPDPSLIRKPVPHKLPTRPAPTAAPVENPFTYQPRK